MRLFGNLADPGNFGRPGSDGKVTFRGKFAALAGISAEIPFGGAIESNREDRFILARLIRFRGLKFIGGEKSSRSTVFSVLLR